MTKQTEKELKAYLESIGDSIVVVSDEDLVKVHVHTNHPGLAFEKGLTYGSLSRMKVDNMREEHQERLIQECPEKVAGKQKPKEAAAQSKLRKNLANHGLYRCVHGRRAGRDLFRDRCRLSDRRRTDDESQHRRHIKCSGNSKCGYDFCPPQ